MDNNLLVSSIAVLSFSFPSGDRWLLPNNAFFKTSTDHPGLLVHGPEEKFKHTGLFFGFSIIYLPLQIVAPRWGGVSQESDITYNKISQWYFINKRIIYD